MTLTDEVVAALGQIVPPNAADGRAIVRGVGSSASSCFVGWDTDRWAVLVVPPSAGQMPPTRLAIYEYEPLTAMRVVGEAGDEIRNASVIRCDLITPAVRLAFTLVASSIATGFASDQGFDVADALLGLQELFQRLAEPPRDTDIVGLWGELFVIANSADVARIARAWRARPDSVFDFASGPDRLEVKTTRSSSRDHWFSLAQLRAGSSSIVVVASLSITAVADGGVSIGNLLTRIEAELSPEHPELALEVLRKAALTLGGEIEGSGSEFDEQQAKASLRLIPFSSIPAIEVPPEVLSARWQVSLSQVTPEVPAALSTHGLASLVASVRRGL